MGLVRVDRQQEAPSRDLVVRFTEPPPIDLGGRRTHRARCRRAATSPAGPDRNPLVTASNRPGGRHSLLHHRADERADASIDEWQRPNPAFPRWILMPLAHSGVGTTARTALREPCTRIRLL